VTSLRWLFLDFNSYFASVEQQVQPALRGKPVAVVPVMVNSTSCIAASYEAKAFGVHTGTNVGEAKALCPGIKLVLARHDLYVEYHHRLVAAVEACLPVDRILSIDEMVGRLYGREQIRENAIALAEHVKATIRERVGEHIKCSIGLAPNRFLAKVAGEIKKPDGLIVLEKHDLPDALYPLSLRDLPGIGRKMQKRLHLHGITTLEQLCALSEKEMHKLWGGIGGERYAIWLRGDDVEVPAIQHRSIGHSHVLEPANRNPDGALRVAKRLIDKAALRLRKMGYWSGGLSVALRLIDGSRWERHVKLPEIQDTATFLTALHQAWIDMPANAPTWIGVTLAPLVPPHRHTPSLFVDEKKEKLSKVMDRINDKYGKRTAMLADLYEVKSDDVPAHIAFNRVPEAWEFEQSDT
jgi:DNA polymerase-4